MNNEDKIKVPESLFKYTNHHGLSIIRDLVFPLSWCDPKKLENGKTIYLSHIPPELIRRVILGCRCPTDILGAVKCARVGNGMSFALLKSKLHKTDYRLVYEEI